MSTQVRTNSQIFQDSNNTYFPNDENEVSILVKEIFDKDSSAELIGSNSKKFIGNKTQAANKISLSKLSGIIEYYPEELYIKVKANTLIEDIERELEKNEQELAFELIDFGFIENGKSNKGTIGGYLACNYAGSRRFKVGSVRDHVLGFRGVNAKGEIIKKTDYNVKTVLKGNFASNSEITFYSKYGDYIARLAILMTLILSLLSISGRLKNY